MQKNNFLFYFFFKKINFNCRNQSSFLMDEYSRINYQSSFVFGRKEFSSQNNKFSTESIYYEHYKRILCPDMLLKQKMNSITELPKIDKIILTTTSKKLVNDKKTILPGLAALELISGQKLKWTLANKSIAAFKLRKNQLIGCKVTLRKKQMYSFLEKLVIILLPRVRDYNGFHKIQNIQNYSLGLSNLLISPELENHFEYFEFFNGITISFVTINKNKYSGTLLLSGFQFPIK
jgi:large subunit ribosomal protein L5